MGLAVAGGEGINENLGTPQTPAEELRPSALPLFFNTENNTGSSGIPAHAEDGCPLQSLFIH